MVDKHQIKVHSVHRIFRAIYFDFFFLLVKKFVEKKIGGREQGGGGHDPPPPLDPRLRDKTSTGILSYQLYNTTAIRNIIEETG